MKKLLSIIALLFVMAAVVPKVANAVGTPCITVIMCDQYVMVCPGDDITPWISILCDDETD